MNVAKRVFLGSVAGLLAVGGAQAAQPVEYVRVCSLYGAGFFYIPGTDTCLKIGAYIRTQAEWGAEGGGVPFGIGNGFGRNTRVDNSDFGFRSRQSVSIDMRTQTEYGTLRSYMEIGAQVTAGGNPAAGGTAAAGDAVFVDRGFVQFAGFTVGRIRSYFDINSFTPYSYANSRISGDTGALGIGGWAYTAQFGNGVTASLSFEDGGAASGGRGRLVGDGSQSPYSLTANTFTTDNRGNAVPDVIGNFRIDQAWGYAAVSAALHDVAGGYYGFNMTGNGHPADKVGFAVTGGFTLNDVLGMTGDQFGMQATYSQGAAGYVTRSTGPSQIWGGGSNVGFGWVSDGIFGAAGSGVELTQVWGINGFYQHMWNPKWRTSLYGGYVEVDYNNTAKTGLCNGGVVGGAAPAPLIGGLAGVSNCNPDFSWWSVGTRTQWNPHPDLDIGVEVLYNHLNTAFAGTATMTAASGARPAGPVTISDQDIVSVMFRWQRNFYP